MPKDASNHGHRNEGVVIFAEQLLDHDGRYIGQLPARSAQHWTSQFVVAANHRREQNREVRRRN